MAPGPLPLRGRVAATLAALAAVGSLALVAGGTPSPTAACPARGHVDPGVSGVQRDRIPTLPAGWSFSNVAADGCAPVRWDPCRAVRYVVNPVDAPPGGLGDVREAFRRLGRVTGFRFVDGGLTDERGGADRAAYQPARYGRQWAPVLVEWRAAPGGTEEIQLVGTGVPTRSGEAYVTARLTLDPRAVTDARARTPVAPGFGTSGGSGPVGPGGVTWGRIVLHELAHVVGLGHTRDPAQLMYPETTEHTIRPARFGDGDLAGLRHLGREAGCHPAPPPGSPTGEAAGGRQVVDAGPRPTR